jgi:hypothetical protein
MKRLLVIIVTLFLAIKPFAQSPQILIPFRVGTKWGYSDTLGKIKIQAKYDTVSFFDYNTVYKGDHVIAIVRFNGKSMAINEKATVIVPAKYEFIKVMEQSAEFAFFVSSKGKFGVYKNGKELFSPIYDYMDVTSYGHFKVHKNNKWGLINDAGKIVIPIAYDELREKNVIQPDIVNWEVIDWGKGRESIKVKTNLQFGRPNLNIPRGVPEIRGYVAPDELNKAADAAKKEFDLDSLRLNNYTGIVFKSKQQGIFLPIEAKKVYLFSKPYSIHSIKYFSPDERGYLKKNSVAYINAVIDGKYGIINEKEEIVLPFEYDHIQEKDGFFLLERNGKISFFIWNSLYPHIQPIFDEYVRKYEIPVNHNWNFILFEIIKKGKPGFVGENGVSYFKD